MTERDKLIEEIASMRIPATCPDGATFLCPGTVMAPFIADFIIEDRRRIASKLRFKRDELANTILNNITSVTVVDKGMTYPSIIDLRKADKSWDEIVHIIADAIISAGPTLIEVAKEGEV